jgi:hypothetical protein
MRSLKGLTMNNLLPKEISLQDLEKLYEHAVEIKKIGDKYGLTGITSIYMTAFHQLKKSQMQIEFPFN